MPITHEATSAAPSSHRRRAPRRYKEPETEGVFTLNLSGYPALLDVPGVARFAKKPAQRTGGTASGIPSA